MNLAVLASPEGILVTVASEEIVVQAHEARGGESLGLHVRGRELFAAITACDG